MIRRHIRNQYKLISFLKSSSLNHSSFLERTKLLKYLPKLSSINQNSCFRYFNSQTNLKQKEETATDPNSNTNAAEPLIFGEESDENKLEINLLQISKTGIMPKALKKYVLQLRQQIQTDNSFYLRRTSKNHFFKEIPFDYLGCPSFIPIPERFIIKEFLESRKKPISEMQFKQVFYDKFLQFLEAYVNNDAEVLKTICEGRFANILIQQLKDLQKHKYKLSIDKSREDNINLEKNMTFIDKIIIKGLNIDRMKNDYNFDYRLDGDFQIEGLKYYCHRYFTGEQMNILFNLNEKNEPIFNFSKMPEVRHKMLLRNQQMILRFTVQLYSNIKILASKSKTGNSIPYNSEEGIMHSLIFEIELDPPDMISILDNSFISWLKLFNLKPLSEFILVDIDGYMNSNPPFRAMVSDEFYNSKIDPKHFKFNMKQLSMENAIEVLADMVPPKEGQIPYFKEDKLLKGKRIDKMYTYLENHLKESGDSEALKKGLLGPHLFKKELLQNIKKESDKMNEAETEQFVHQKLKKIEQREKNIKRKSIQEQKDLQDESVKELDDNLEEILEERETHEKKKDDPQKEKEQEKEKIGSNKLSKPKKGESKKPPKEEPKKEAK